MSEKWTLFAFRTWFLRRSEVKSDDLNYRASVSVGSVILFPFSEHTVRDAMILIPIFLILFACWMLWGWTVGESKDIRWLRHWCAPIFVVTAMLISAGAGAVVTRGIVRNRVRDDVTQLLATIEQKILTGQSRKVVSEIQATDRSEDPDRDAFDLLDHITVMQENLSPSREEVAETFDGSVVR